MLVELQSVLVPVIYTCFAAYDTASMNCHSVTLPLSKRGLLQMAAPFCGHWQIPLSAE